MRGRLIGAMAVVGLLVVVVALSGGRSPAAGQAKPAVKKLDFPHVTPPPESSGTAFKWMAEELTKRSGGALTSYSTAAPCSPRSSRSWTP